MPTAGAWSFSGPRVHQHRPHVKLPARRETSAAGTPSLPTGSASRPRSREHTSAAFRVEVSHTEAEVVGSPMASPRLELPRPHMDLDQGSWVAGSPVAPPAVEHELSHAEAEPRARQRRPWGRGHSCRSWHRGLPDAAF
jgi:hypothetical protein